MEIIDNFGLPSKSREGFNPWMENILELMSEKGVNSKITVRLTAHRTNTSIIYILRNSQNKNSANIFKKNKILHVELYKRDLPNLSKSIRPENVKLSAYAFRKIDLEELLDVADLLLKHMVMDTPYSLGTVKKIKVAPVKEQWSNDVLIGGQITGIVYDEYGDGVSIFIENGKANYQMSRSDFDGVRLSLLKCIVFNRNKFALINSPEFDRYYEIIDGDMCC